MCAQSSDDRPRSHRRSVRLSAPDATAASFDGPLRLARAALGVELAFVLDPSGEVLAIGLAPELGFCAPPLAARRLAAEAIARREVRVAPAGFRPDSAEARFTSFAAAPLLTSAGRPAGAVVACDATSGEWSASRLEILEAIAASSAASLDLLEAAQERARIARELERAATENRRLYGAEQRARLAAELSADRTSKLQALTAALSQPMTTASVAEVVLREGLAALEAPAGVLTMFDPAKQELAVLRAEGYPPELIERFRTFPVSANVPLAEAFRTATPVFLESTEARDARYPELRELSASGRAGWAAVPLVAEGEALGALGLSFAAGRTFDEEERSLLMTLGSQCAQALHRAALFAAERESRGLAERAQMRLAVLAELGESLGEALDIEAIRASLGAILVPRVADWSTLHLQRADGAIETLPPHFATPRLTELGARIEAALDPSERLGLPTHLMLQTSEPVFVPEVSDAMLEASGLTGEALALTLELAPRSVIILPLIARGRTLGAIDFCRTEGRPRFTEEDFELAKDVARRAAMAIHNARLYRDLQEADRRKDEFVAMLAHELRNPLGAVLSAARLLGTPAVAASSHDLARGVVERQVRHMVRLVDDLLDASRVTRGVVELQPTLMDLTQATTNAIEQVRPLLAARRHRLELSAAPEPVLVRGDATRLEQVVANLIDNAAKYTEPGGLLALSVTADGDEALICLKDSGAGIDPQLLPRVFDLFVQSPRGPDRTQGGLGIGLTLVRQIVELHGGSVRARSEGAGRGTEILVRLPLARGATLPVSSALGVPPAARRPPRPLRVLVVEDNVDALMMLADALLVLGHDVRTAHDGIAALSAAAQHAPEVVLLDIGLPGLDGLEVARRLRATRGGVGMHLVALTGYGQEADRRRSHEAGFDRHLVKPVDIDALEAILDERARAEPIADSRDRA